MKITRNSRSKTTLALGLIVSLAICFSAAALGGLATTSSVNGDWFADLNKPSWNPPNWIFGPLWSALYLMTAVAAWLVWNQSGFVKSRGALVWFGLHLVLNIMWSVLFFALQQAPSTREPLYAIFTNCMGATRAVSTQTIGVFDLRFNAFKKRRGGSTGISSVTTTLAMFASVSRCRCRSL